MAVTVELHDEPRRVLESADHFLTSHPVHHNLVLTLLHQRVSRSEPGRYWVAHGDGRVAGVAFQSPLDYHVTVTPMPHEVVTAVVEAAVEAGVTLPGVHGEAATAAGFAGQWSERTASAARPVLGQRIYELGDLVDPARVPGCARPADPEDHAVLVRWAQSFSGETGERPSDPDTGSVVERRIMAGQLWVWEDGEAVCFAGRSEPVARTTRIGPVYTPTEHRNRGYAAALVAAVSAAARQQGLGCMLFTDLANPTSNSIYRRLGYRAVQELLRYDFMAAPTLPGRC